MENGTDSEPFVEISCARTGLKREFAFAMKSQSEIYASFNRSGSLSRSRASKNRNVVRVSDRMTNKPVEVKNDSPTGLEETKEVVVMDVVEEKRDAIRSGVVDIKETKNQVGDEIYEKELKSGVGLEEEPKTLGDDKPKIGDGNVLECHGVDMSNKNFVNKKFPTKLKDLLSSGILEGLPAKEPTGLKGVISSIGIVCYCETCNGVKVLTPTTFEVHAGSLNKRPAEYIFLENGSTLRDIMNTCLNVPLHTLEESIQKLLGGFTMKKSMFCLNCRDVNVASRLLCNSCMGLKSCQLSPTPTTQTSNSSVSLAVQSRSSEPLALPNSLNNGMKSNKFRGKQTKKDVDLHKLVFEEDGLLDGTKLAYHAHGKPILNGYKMGSGIVCSCCRSKISPSQFEAHAGCASRRKPYKHIYTSDRVSLHELSISISKDRKLSANNEDLCAICRDGGDLLCCDGCPKSFHIDCVPLSTVPEGQWYCRYCRNVERNANDRAAGRIEGIDSSEQINQTSIQIVESSQVVTYDDGCTLCKSKDFTDAFGPLTLIICDQCEKEFHVGCLKGHDMRNLEELPEGKWFCTSHCDQIHITLKKLLADGGQRPVDSLLRLIKRKPEKKGSETGANLNIKWRVLNWKMDERRESRRLLANVIALFDERFDPITDPISNVNLIPAMISGWNVHNVDFSGMFVAVLIVKEKIVSAGAFRILGQEVAELPLVATKKKFQGQGYFQCLFYCIENLLASLKVRDFIVQAAEGAESFWTSKFGFRKLEEEEANYYVRNYRIAMFNGTSLLKKSVPSV